MKKGTLKLSSLQNDTTESKFWHHIFSLPATASELNTFRTIGQYVNHNVTTLQTQHGSLVGSMSTLYTSRPKIYHCYWLILLWRIFSLFCWFKKSKLSKDWALNTGKLAQEHCGKINDCPNMTAAVYHGRKAINQTNNSSKVNNSLKYKA